MPERGVPGYADAAAAAVQRAREIGAQQGARLVVIGQVLSEDRVALAFIDPGELDRLKQLIRGSE